MTFSDFKFSAALRSSLFACLVLFSVRTFAADKVGRQKALPTEELEKSGDAPTFVWRTDLSPAMVSQHGGFTSYQVNVGANGQNIVGDAANEPSITVDPTNPNKMSIGWRQFDSVGSNFRKAGWGYTSNGGASWTFPGSLENIFRSDPVLASDETGRFFYLSLQSSLLDDMFRSLNGGASWTKLGPATGGDKQWFTVDNTNSSPGHGFQYQIWSTASNPTPGRQFSRSTDGGFTWMNPISIPQTPIWGTPDVDSNGTLFIGGVNPNNSAQFWCIRSSNAKNAAVTPTFDLIKLVNLGGDIDSGGSINPVGLSGQLFLAVDRSGTTTNNNVYMLTTVFPFTQSPRTEVMFVRSTDSGQTFSAPRRITDDPINPNKWHWLGTFSVAPNGRIDAVWLDTRNAANNTDSQLFYSYSNDAGTSWSTNVAVSDPFNPFLGYPNQAKMGDYMTIVSDNTGGNVAYTATLNGEEDIYYVHVAPPPQLLNISSRARVLADDKVLIAGFIISGTTPKKVLIRGIGPSLNGVGATLSNPTLELHQGDATLVTNDDWKTRSDGTSQQAEIENTTIPPSNNLESAMVVTLAPGNYSAILAGKDGSTGIGVVEVYDLGQTVNSRVANISTRGLVDTEDNVLIGGFILGSGGGDGAKVVVRALGPSLAPNVPGALVDPTLELHNANGVTMATNDNWKINDQTQQTQETEVRATGIPPSNDFESAIVTTLPAGTYTAIVRGKNNTAGIGLVEFYDVF
ncbi:MAG: hypothetical protein QOH88_2181 [Verrucomicrobiota bacterium]|jgi:hypothetical protein